MPPPGLPCPLVEVPSGQLEWAAADAGWREPLELGLLTHAGADQGEPQSAQWQVVSVMAP